MTTPKEITIGGRKTPLAPIEAYIKHLRLKRIGDCQAYEWERSRLHNAIFNAAGLPDKAGTRARIIGYSGCRGDEDAPYKAFNDDLETVLCHALACPSCGYTLRYDQTCGNPRCQNFGKKVTALDNIKTLREMAKKQERSE